MSLYSEKVFFDFQSRSFEHAHPKQKKKHLPLRKIVENHILLSGRLSIPPSENEILDMEKDNLVYHQQQHSHFKSCNLRESIPNRIVGVSKPYLRPIVREKEAMNVELGAKCNNIQNSSIKYARPSQTKKKEMRERSLQR